MKTRTLIVLATHDDSLIDVLDVVYEIQDKQLVCIKKSKSEVSAHLLQGSSSSFIISPFIFRWLGPGSGRNVCFTY